MKVHHQILPLFGFLSTLGLLFSPLVEVHTLEQTPRDLIIFGTQITGDTKQFTGLFAAQDFQFYALVALLICWLVAFFSQKETRVAVLSFGIFIISMLPVWLMVYVEDIIKHQISDGLEHHYVYGITFAAVALICGTFGIIEAKPAKRSIAPNLLDQGV